MPRYRIQLQLDQQIHSIDSDDDTPLLEAIRNLGLPARQACRNGVCRICRCRLLSGEITYHDRRPHGLYEQDIRQGLILPCIAFARSDLTLDRIATERRWGSPPDAD